MSKTNKYKAHAYALSKGIEPGTPEYREIILVFTQGYAAGLRDGETLKRRLIQAKRLLRQTFRLPQNKPWNTLFPEGETIREAIKRFLAK